jgi:hypothetical protein
MNSEELLRIYNNPEDERAKGNVVMAVRYARLSFLLDFAYYSDDCAISMHHEIVEENGRVKIIIGSPELMEPDTYHRRAYQMPQTHREALGAIGFPEKIGAINYFENTIAFDRESGTLVIIDKKDSLLFVFAEALGGSSNVFRAIAANQRRHFMSIW